ncbi:hypothetical protein, partial [Anaerophaga thermohalophila]|uniref:hypothetical protein n=1 Tax=Anaerophaga thermohalophila TaxID=177400 RepID=UPI000237CE33
MSATLVPDPLEPDCPWTFKEAVGHLLGKDNNKQQGDPYKPYDDIPWTTVIDPIEDNLRCKKRLPGQLPLCAQSA